MESITFEDQIFMTLMKIRRSYTNLHLAQLFSCSVGTIANIVTTFIHVLHSILFQDTCIMTSVPPIDKNKLFAPSSFSQFTSCRMVIDCTDIEIAAPSLVSQQNESLIGHLHHAAKVVWPGRTFLRRLIDLLCCFRNRDHPIRINREFRQDLLWWQRFLSSWHGVGFWLYPGMSPLADIEVTSDAAGSLGFGAYSRGQWFYGPWSPTQAQQSIAYKELFPVVIAAHLWGSHWSRKHVLFRSR